MATLPYAIGPKEHIVAIERHLQNMLAQIEALEDRLPDRPSPLETAKAMLRFNRQMAAQFGDRLGTVPGLNMMLDLLVAESKQRQIGVHSLCIASGVPPTTALAWIRQMTAAGLFSKVPHQTDGRSHWVELTEEGKTRLLALLSEWR